MTRKKNQKEKPVEAFFLQQRKKTNPTRIVSTTRCAGPNN
jgi:hypothetical protein